MILFMGESWGFRFRGLFNGPLFFTKKEKCLGDTVMDNNNFIIYVKLSYYLYYQFYYIIYFI